MICFIVGTEFLADRLDLLVEVVVALILLHLLLDAAMDTAFDRQNVHFVVKNVDDFVQAPLKRRLIQNLLLAGIVNGQLAGNSVGQSHGRRAFANRL